MNQAELLGKIAAGNARVAQYLGTSCSQYRPDGASNPIVAGNLIGVLPVFLTPSEKLQEHPEWIAEFDYSDTLQGDYFVTVTGTTYFIAAQVAFAPIVCMQTNAIVSLVRPEGITAVGTGGYSGVIALSADTLLSDWPVSVAASGRAKQGEVPNDDGLSAWVFLLPLLPIIPMVADIITDNLQRTFIVNAAEHTSLGWQLHAKQASS